MVTLIVSRQMVTSHYPNAHPDQKLAGLSVDGCGEFDFFHHNSSFVLNSAESLPLPHSTNDPFKMESFLEASTPDLKEIKDVTKSSTKDISERFLIYITGISYMWYPCLGCTLSVTLGLCFSILIGRFEKSRGVNPDYLSPPALWLLTKLFPNQVMNWLQVDGCPMLTSSGGCSFTLSVRRRTIHIVRQP